jgi:hypothetical protein
VPGDVVLSAGDKRSRLLPDSQNYCLPLFTLRGAIFHHCYDHASRDDDKKPSNVATFQRRTTLHFRLEALIHMQIEAHLLATKRLPNKNGKPDFRRCLDLRLNHN